MVSSIKSNLLPSVRLLVIVLASLFFITPASASINHTISRQAIEQGAINSESVSSQSSDSPEGQTVKKNLWQKISESFENNIIKEQRWKLIIDGLYYTVIIALLSLLFGALLGCGVCAMRMNKNNLLRGIAIGFIYLIRGIPVLVLLMILFYAVFSPFGLSAIPVSIITLSIEKTFSTLNAMFPNSVRRWVWCFSTSTSSSICRFLIT